MPHRKKTRTKSTDAPMPRRLRRLMQIRMEVAAEAARIIATEGQHNYHAAKKKAAERIGISERLALPSNIEVKDALRSYQVLYGGAAHEQNIRRLRQTAARAMRLLTDFNPRLVGAVLDGTAEEHSRVSLHVFADSVESVVFFFAERGIAHDQDQRRIRWYSGTHMTVPLVLADLEGQVIELAVFEEKHLRQPPPSPIDGRPQQRASLHEVEALLTGESV